MDIGFLALFKKGRIKRKKRINKKDQRRVTKASRVKNK